MSKTVQKIAGAFVAASTLVTGVTGAIAADKKGKVNPTPSYESTLPEHPGGVYRPGQGSMKDGPHVGAATNQDVAPRYLELGVEGGRVNVGEHGANIAKFSADLVKPVGPGFDVLVGAFHTQQIGGSNVVETISPIDDTYQGVCDHTMKYRNTGAKLGARVGGHRVKVEAGATISHMDISEKAGCETSLTSTGEKFPSTHVDYDLGRSGFAAGAYGQAQFNISESITLKGQVAAPNLFAGPGPETAVEVTGGVTFKLGGRE